MRRLLRCGLRWRNSPGRGRGKQALQFDAGHATAFHLQHPKPKPPEIKALASAGNEAQMSEHKSAKCGVGGIFGEFDFILCLEVAKSYGAVKNHGHFRS